jgi:glycine/D-amino acid oxidase-like deaminating enzyme/nitrite reductase/ring-hydroxylating ferredoxin subunit
MNVGNEHSTSFWMKETPITTASPLAGDVTCDVVVVGSGIAGLSTAYELTRCGKSVVVIDRGGIGTGMTARTTAHLATELDDRYFDLIRIRGEDEARLYYDSQVAAVNRIEAICRDEGIDCDLHRLDGYLIPTEEGPIADLQEEYDACRRLDVDVHWADRAPVPGLDTGRCLRFPNQGRFHPTRYLAGLARAILDSGGRLYSNTANVDHDERDHGVVLATEKGHKIRAKAAVFATNSPVNAKLALHTKQVPDRTYVIAGRVPKGSVPDILLWDTYEAYHYVRLQEVSESEDLLIVGGEDHRSGEATDMDQRLGNLADWTRKRFPSFRNVDYSWSGQVLEPMDFMPFSGLSPGSKHIYLHTGDSGQGITNGVAGSLTIAALILGRDSRYAAILSPSRKSFTSRISLGEFASGQAGVLKNLAEYAGPAEIGSVDELKPGEGGILRDGAKRIAAYCGRDGEVICRSAACTHMGCVVQWNPFEQCWDCPCHGSQFAPDGQVLNGPAVKPLGEVGQHQEQPREQQPQRV